MQTAFCSYQERTKESGSSFLQDIKCICKCHSNLDRTISIITLTHIHQSWKTTDLSRSRSLKRNFPHARVRTILSEGVCFTNSV